MTTQPITTNDLLERLAVCHREITGIQTAWEKPPVDRMDDSMVPCVYPFQVGPMTQPTPVQRDGAGKATITRRFVFRALISRQGIELAEAGVGSPGYDLAVPYLDSFAQYYLAHPFLQTDGTNEAAKAGYGLIQDLLFQDSGIKQVSAPGGGLWWGFDETLIISLRLFSNRLS